MRGILLIRQASNWNKLKNNHRAINSYMHLQQVCFLASETAPSICRLHKPLKIKPILSSSIAHLNATEAALPAKLDRIFAEKYQRDMGSLQKSESLIQSSQCAESPLHTAALVHCRDTMRSSCTKTQFILFTVRVKEREREKVTFKVWQCYQLIIHWLKR